MQTFLPYPNFEQSAQCLDDRRLNKQRLEVVQILETLNGLGGPWYNHACVRMWRTHSYTLAIYGRKICAEWVMRGHDDGGISEQIDQLISYYNLCIVQGLMKTRSPSWLGDERLHSSHRAALLKKDYAYYSRFGWTEEPKIDYWWPVTM